MEQLEAILENSPAAHDLLPLLNKGIYMAMKEDRAGKILAVTTSSIVPATQEQVWDALTDYEHYADFLPAIRRLKVRRRNNEAILLSEVGLKVMGVGGYTSFKQRIQRSDPFLVLKDYDSGELTGFWKVMPLDSDETILMHHSIVTDPGEFMAFMRWLIRVFPPAEIAFSVTPDVVMMQCMKRRILNRR